MVSADGQSFVLQCGDRTVKFWRASATGVTDLGVIPLFLAAKQAGIVPEAWGCPGLEQDSRSARLEFLIRLSDAFDCDVVDRALDDRSYIVRNAESNVYYVVAPSLAAPRALAVYTGGVLLPRAGPPAEIVLTLESPRGRGLEVRSIEGRARDVSPLLVFPRRSLPWEEAESEAVELRYSAAHNLLIVACGGLFRTYRGDIAFVRAYSPTGEERWTMRKPLATRADGYSEGRAHILLFADGRFGTVSSSIKTDKPIFDLVDMSNGKTVASLEGKPIAASSNAGRVLVENASGDFLLMDYTVRRQ